MDVGGESLVYSTGGQGCRKNPCVQHGGGQGKSFRGISHQGGFLTLTGLQEMVGSFPWQDLVYHKLYGKEPGVGRTIHLSHSYEREAELALLTPLLRFVSSNLHSKLPPLPAAASGCGLIWDYRPWLRKALTGKGGVSVWFSHDHCLMWGPLLLDS